MSTGIFPLIFANEEFRLLTGIGIGFLFGFALERAGFGNARKLAAQFYLTDMTVFKVMFTAILVAMVGLYVLVGFGMVDLARLWINPTFVWAQVVGGFLLGVGFIMSGLCPGTSVVSAASGRWDGAVTLAGIFVGTFAFTVAIDVFPALERLYESASLGASVLPEVFGLPTLWFVLLIVVVAGLAFIGAEKVESIFGRRAPEVELTPRSRPRAKLGLATALVAILAVALGFRPAPAPDTRAVPAAIEPLALAERIIAKDPTLLVLDVRADRGEELVPGSFTVATDSSALPALASATAATDVILIDDDGTLDALPGDWPVGPNYRLLRDGWAGWRADVLEPAAPADASLAAIEHARRQNAIAAFFSGAAAAVPAIAAPPPSMSTGGGAKPKRGGC